LIEYTDIIDSIRLDEVLDGLDIRVVEIKKGEHWASCPLPTHPGADSSPSFSVNEDTLLFNCFTCGEGGPLPLLVAAMNDYETDAGGKRWDKAVEWLLPFSDGEVDTDQGFMEQLERYLDRADEKPHRTRKHEMPYFSTRVLEKLDYAPLELVEKWNITDERTVEQFNLRFDPERHRRVNDYTGPALIIPHFYHGDLVGYQERWLSDDRPKKMPKYTNSEDFPKALTLFNMDGAVEEARRGLPVIVVESTMTVIRLWELGYTSVATFGASVSDEQVRLLTSFSGGLILVFDSDPDYLNERGKWVTGAGKKALADTTTKLFDFVFPLEICEFMTDNKDDLADLPEDEVHGLIQGRVMLTKPLQSRPARPNK
jgi:DNA primase